LNIGICIKGLEDIAAEEVNGKTIASGRVGFEGDVKDFKSLKLVYSLEDEFKFKGKLEIIRKIAKKLDFKGSFMIMCEREGKHKFNSGWIISELNEKLKNKDKKIDYKNPEHTIFVDIIDKKCLFGFLIKKDMYKRSYRVKLRGATVYPCVAYSMLKLIDYKQEESFLDPRCSDGVIVIEAALFGGKSVNGIDRNIRDTRINAKIAKVNINLHEGDFDLIKEFKNIDKIATYLPSVSKTKGESMISGIYRKFLSNTKKVLNGKMAILVEKAELIKELSESFKLIEERKIFIGDSEQFILIFE